MHLSAHMEINKPAKQRKLLVVTKFAANLTEGGRALHRLHARWYPHELLRFVFSSSSGLAA